MGRLGAGLLPGRKPPAESYKRVRASAAGVGGRSKRKRRPLASGGREKSSPRVGHSGPKPAEPGGQTQDGQGSSQALSLSSAAIPRCQDSHTLFRTQKVFPTSLLKPAGSLA